MDFISRDALIGAMHAWVLVKTKPLGQLLAVGGVGSVKKDLEKIAVPEVYASLVHVSAARAKDDDPYATASYSVGTATSARLRFRIVRPDAEGGLGKVYVALDEELHREVALKEIQDRHADDKDSRSRSRSKPRLPAGAFSCAFAPGRPILPARGAGCAGDALFLSVRLPERLAWSKGGPHHAL